MRKVLFILGLLEDSDLQWFVEAGEPRRVSRGDEILSEGRPVRELFVLIEGELAVRKAGHELARLGVGEVVGEMSLLDSRPAIATIAAENDSTVFGVSQNLLRSKLQSDTGFGARFYRAVCTLLANRLSRMDLMLGKRQTRGAPEPAAEPEEIAPETLEYLSLAGARFDWFLQQVRSLHGTPI